MAILPADSGAVAISGSAIGIRAGRKAATSSGALALMGQSVALQATRELPVTGGAIGLGGTPAALQVARVLAANAGAMAISGMAVTFTGGGRNPTARLLVVSSPTATLTVE